MATGSGGGQAVQAVGDQVGPGGGGGQAQSGSSGVADDAAGGGEQAQPQTFWVPGPGGVFGEGEQLQPGGQVHRLGDDGQPDAVLVEIVQRQAGQAGVFGVAD